MAHKETKGTTKKATGYARYLMDEEDFQQLQLVCYPDRPLDVASRDAKGKAIQFWKDLGKKMKFVWNSASPDGDNPRRFMAIPRKGSMPNG